MKFFICLFLFISVISSSPISHEETKLPESEIYQEFLDFQQRFNKTYDSIEETMKRYEIFKENLHTTFKHKILNPKASYGVTVFSDMTSDEFHTTFMKLTPSLSSSQSPFTLNFLGEVNYDLGSDFEMPETFDWREKGVNDPIENQGACWSCWAFTTITNIEALYFIKYGKKIKLSEQQLIDCDDKNDGCKGGLMTTAYNYIMDVGGLMLEKDYPYTDKKKECKFDASKAVVNIKGFTRIPSDPKEMTKALLKIGPLGAGINGRFLQFYKGGILDLATCSSDLSHAVVIMGYGVEEVNGVKEEYWLLKNEWGSVWGEKGYFRVRKTDGDGMCGINTYVSTALISDFKNAVQE